MGVAAAEVAEAVEFLVAVPLRDIVVCAVPWRVVAVADDVEVMVEFCIDAPVVPLPAAMALERSDIVA